MLCSQQLDHQPLLFEPLRKQSQEPEQNRDEGLGRRGFGELAGAGGGAGGQGSGGLKGPDEMRMEGLPFLEEAWPSVPHPIQA